MTIVVTGYMLRHPLAGNIFAFFHYVLGLSRLGHQVVYLEESGWEQSSYDPATGEQSDHPTAGLRIVRDLMARHDVAVPVCFVNRATGLVDGLTWDAVKAHLRSADLLLNVGGVCWLPEFLLCDRRALIDMDPMFTQAGRFGSHLLSDHHTHFSYGANIGRDGCHVPTLGFDWKPLAPPVVLDLWPLATPPQPASFTTIASWTAYGSVVHKGERYGQKNEEFLRIVDLPGRVSVPLELAASNTDAATRTRLTQAGWRVVNAGDVSTDAASYQRYIRNSAGEFSVAKHGYVKSWSGWFSDRSVCYLAAGLPVVLQDTGFSEWLPTGMGAIAFRSEDEAVEALGDVQRRYVAHRGAAHDLASRVFAHDVVLPALLDAAVAR